MIMPLCTNGGEDDIFEANPWNFESYADYCEAQYDFRPNVDDVEKQYGGKNLDTASNIVFRYHIKIYNITQVHTRRLFICRRESIITLHYNNLFSIK